MHALIWRVSLLLCCLIVAYPSAASDEDVLQQYLQRLGLNDLQMQQLEKMIQLPREEQQLKKDVKQLADLYVSGLLDAASDADRRNSLVRRVNQLIEKHPSARTPALEVMLLQADYAAAEVAAEKWLADPGQQAEAQTAAEILRRITPQLDKHLAELDSKTEALVKALDATTTETQSERVQGELEQTQQVAGRARFYFAWAQYYLGALQAPAAAAGENFAKSREVFRKFLGIEEGYTDLSGDDLGLGSPAIARAMLGLVQAEIGSGHLPESRQCLDLLKHSQAPLEIRQQEKFWYLQGLINAGMIAEAADFAKAALADAGTSNQASQLSVSVRSAVAGLARSSGQDAALELGLAGIAGLTKLRRFQIARQLLDKYSVDISTADDFYLLWIRGQQLLAAAERSKRPAEFELAADTFRRALEKPEAQQDKASASRCRYELSYCQFKLGRSFESAENYAALISELASIDRAMAANAAWMAFVGYQKSLAEHPEGRRKAIRVLETLKQNFPQSPHAEKVDYQISLLSRDSQSPEAAMAELESIDPKNENYVDSRYDLCLMAHKQWAAAKADQKTQLRRQVLKQVDTFLGAADSSDQKRRMKCLLLAADALLSGPQPDSSSAAGYLQQAKAIATQNDPTGPSAAEYHYRMLQLAMKNNDEAEIVQHAAWITDNASGSPFELPALVQRAQRVSGGDSDPAEGYQIYRRLVDIFGDEPSTMEANKNARISSFNLAKYAAALGKFNEAAAAADRVLQTDPKNKRYLTLSAESNYKAGNFQNAVDRYRTLVRGLPAGSDEWYQAKYHHIASLLKVDADKGKQVLKQFQLMHRDIGPPWNEKFQQLAARDAGR